MCGDIYQSLVRVAVVGGGVAVSYRVRYVV
jgi:hypothetical protein